MQKDGEKKKGSKRKREKEEDSKKETPLKDQQSEDPLVNIRNEDLKKRISAREESENAFDILLSGTSATLVIQLEKKLYVAWVGDSMLAYCGKTQAKNAFQTEPAHKPNLKNEKYRIYNQRGEIKETSDGLQRIFLRGRMYPGLKISRTIGDLIPH